MQTIPFYDPMKSYGENFQEGPFGDFTNDEKCEVRVESGKKFLGSEVDLPFGVPAGPLLNSKFCRSAFEKGFDVCVYKTVRSRQYSCHAWPNIVGVEIEGDLTLEKAKGKLVGKTTYKEPLSITNSFGVPSPDVSWWQEDMAKAVEVAGEGQVLVGSFQGTGDGSGFKAQLDDYVLSSRLVKETGAKILEANLSCPNEGTADLLCFDVDSVRQIAEGIKNEVGEMPLILKLAYFENDGHLKELVKSVGKVVQGLAVINTIPAEVVNEKEEQALPGKGRLRSGICGKAIQWAGVEMVSRLNRLRLEMGMQFEIVGVGGVTVPEDYNRYISAGADLVMSATGAMWDPNLGCKIKKMIKEER